ncbi:AraC family transcriptional regulator ligand-binding domain-containing protein [Pseudomonas sp. LS44]|uniref:AraC family transcriptional regulator ligand-binding domain-containing protein n=1 Tax=Pseudomonas sp. LS44 TaxID=1357074 RepID=UPI00215B4B90|nr:AraC family transcriptional regulator ligand-binding domain-containing protein [Pseudomonas sp. LS44]UVE16052.1 AraC family transcriptional regulator ligand-binding domain-containing protein [Pseudomonas sp. LS44]
MQQEPMVASAWPSTILSHAAQYNLPIHELCTRVGLCPDALRDHSLAIPARQVLQLFDECAAIGADPQFGCELRARLATGSLQGLNILFDTAATLGDSLQCLTECLPILMGHIQPELSHHDGFSRLTFNATLPPHAFGLDSSLLALVRNMARRVNRRPAELVVEAQITPEQNCDALLQSWGISYRRGPTLSLLLPSAALAWPLQGANDFLHQSLRATWQQPQANQSLAERLTMAKQLLKCSDRSIESIALTSGYRQAGNFIRAFRTHYGITPKQFRLTCD